MRIFRGSIVAVTAALFSLHVDASEIGAEIANQVSITNYEHYLEDLLYTHQGHNRNYNGAQHDLARNNIQTTLESLGLDVELHPFTFMGVTHYNVIATKPGALYPDVALVVGGHYDSENNPGADDDASGVAGVMELARIFATYDTAYTLKFCAWDVEEQGLVGSRAYVAETRTASVRAMIQIDMVARDAGLNRQDLYAGTIATGLRDGLVAAFPLYGNGLGVQTNPHASFSDHAPFYDAGYPAVCFVEDAYTSNMCYHNPCDHVDQVNYLNYTFATNLVRVVGGYLADNALAYHAGDWNNNAVADADEIAANPALDCNGNGILDAFEPALARDCNANGTPDLCDIAGGAAVDNDHNGVPDSCQTTRLVPSQYGNIQAALDAAVDGDRIEVAAGTYTGSGNTNLDFLGKRLTLRSAPGAALAVLLGGTNRSLYFHSGETHASVVDGFTIMSGNGGGPNPSHGGGAVLCIDSGPLFRNCTFRQNAAGGGGAVHCYQRSHAAFVNCTFESNSSSSTGGALRAALGSQPTLVNCVFSANTAATGGAIECSLTAEPTLINCTLSRNHATNQGGALYQGPQAAINRSHATLINCVVWGNTAASSGPNLFASGTTFVSVMSSDVQGGQAGIVGGGTVVTYANNINADPLFADAPMHNYELNAASPAIDAGDNTRVPADFADLDADGNANEALSQDRAGRARFVDDPAVANTGIGTPPHVDMGAYERQAAPPCPGDLDGDNVVDLSDLTVLLAHYGTESGATYADGDLTGDGAVSLGDLTELLSRFGSSCP